MLIKAFLLMFSLCLTTDAWADVSSLPPPPEQTSRHPWYEYHDGNIEKARVGYERIIAERKDSKRLIPKWHAFMEAAWFYHQIGESQRSIDYSNRALELGKEIGRPFYIGRSLSWLAWGYADLGLYDLAVQFYTQSIELGAPEGKIEIISLWGMSTQELGYIYFRKGELEEAKEKITETTDFARRRKIWVGVGEGGAHLAEIALLEGRVREARTLANEAVEASIRCGCSPLNIARAKVVLAKAAVEEARVDQALDKEAQEAVQDVLAYAEKHAVGRFLAEAMILKSRLLPADDFEGRYQLLSHAYESLENLGNEHRGVAGAELGRLFLENSRMELAEFYLKQGYQVNQELFRTIDSSEVLAEIATLEGLKGNIRKRLKKTELAALEAKKRGALPLAFENESELSAEFFKLGYSRMSQKWTEQALETLSDLLNHQNEAKKKKVLLEHKLLLSERLLELRVKLTPVVAGKYTGKPEGTR